eukprot:gene11687-4_t
MAQSRESACELGNWWDDKNLKKDLRCYVGSNMKRVEILDFVKRDYFRYSWRIPALDRRLRYFGIRYVNRAIPLPEVIDAVQAELDGGGQTLGYRSMNLKLRNEYGIFVPRKLVSDIMWDIDPEGVEARKLRKNKKGMKRPFICDGPNQLFSLDGHDKMMGFQNSTFPLAIYGCLDTFSRKIISLNVWTGNSNPLVIGKFFMMYLNKAKIIPNYIRIDKGTETGVMAAMHTYLRSKTGDLEDPTESVIYGPSTSNKIERWWRALHERMEKGLTLYLNQLLSRCLYDPHNARDRNILAYIFIPVLKRECDAFVRLWNSHRIRQQKELQLPTGIPDHMYAFPEHYGGENKGFVVAENDLIDAADYAELINAP